MRTFAEDVEKGLSDMPKFISPKYFYDDEGSKIFKTITTVDEYYPTKCEFEILFSYRSRLLDIIKQYHEKFSLIELGAGDAHKTRLLIEYFMLNKVNFKYVPVDICAEENQRLESRLKEEFPALKVKPANGDFLESLSLLKKNKNGKLVLFLGSTIGNLPERESIKFLKKLRKNLNKNDMLLLGFDLKKNPKLIANAYNDSQGHTRDFNLNLLKRINRELNGNFDPALFEHYPTYDPVSGEARSYLVSRTSHAVYIGKLQKEFIFEEGEVIFTEMSRKFTPDHIAELCEHCGFRLKENFSDSRNFFCDSLWIRK